MRQATFLALGAVLVIGLILCGLPAGAQQPEQVYTIGWWTVDGGGATFSTGGGYSLGNTTGQPDAGALAGGGYTLGGGFWKGGAAAPALDFGIFLPVILKGS